MKARYTNLKQALKVSGCTMEGIQDLIEQGLIELSEDGTQVRAKKEIFNKFQNMLKEDGERMSKLSPEELMEEQYVDLFTGEKVPNPYKEMYEKFKKNKPKGF